MQAGVCPELSPTLGMQACPPPRHLQVDGSPARGAELAGHEGIGRILVLPAREVAEDAAPVEPVSLPLRALQESLLANSRPAAPVAPLRDSSSFERDLQLAMELSAQEQKERELRRQEEEEAELAEALRLSLLEK